MNKKIMALFTVICLTLTFTIPALTTVKASDETTSPTEATEKAKEDKAGFIVNGEKNVDKVANVSGVTFSYEAKEGDKDEFGKEYFYNKVGDKERANEGDTIEIDQSVQGVQSFEIWASSYDKEDKFEKTTISVLIQDPKSVINIDGNVDGSVVVTNPKSITVGTEDSSKAQKYKYDWEITDDNGKVVSKGENSQPVMAKVAALKVGDYSISNTVSANVDENYGGGVVENTVSSSFKIATASDESSKTNAKTTAEEPEDLYDVNSGTNADSTEKGKVTVIHYFRVGTKSGTKVTNTMSGKIGESYTVQPKTEEQINELSKKNSNITNEYKLDESKTVGNVNGTYSADGATVEFYYIKPDSSTGTTGTTSTNNKKTTTTLPKAGVKTTLTYVVLGSVVLGAGAYFFVDKKYFIV